jgi:sulfide:quinone oxidoreductase
LRKPGPLVVGATAGAACFGPAYEFVLMADWVLRKRGLRDKVDITYVTSEPHAGHFGVGGVKNAKKLTSSLLEKQGIKVIDNAAITDIEAKCINLSDGQKLPFSYSMIIPPFRGVKFVKETPGLSDAKGFIPVLPTYQHDQFSSVYALGVCVQLKQPEKTPVPIGLPKSGQMSEAMGVAVAHNIAVQLGEIKSPLKTPTLETVCFAEFGDTGITYIAAPVVPDPVTGKRRYSLAIKGIWVNWMKLAFEEYFMLKMKMGLGVPWFENLGLRILFGLSLLKPLPIEENKLMNAMVNKQ